MIREMLTLREIARRLDVPPSSIAYYKDRFARFLPVGEGRGRRLRYPVHVLGIFREIREMYAHNMAAEQIEERLGELAPAQTASGGRHGQPGEPIRPGRWGAWGTEAGAGPHLRNRFHASWGHPDGEHPRDAVSRVADGAAASAPEESPGLLDRMGALLQAHGHMRAELDGLQRQVAELRAERGMLLAAFEERAARLDEALALLRRERAEVVTRFVDDYYAAVSASAAAGEAGWDGTVDEGARSGGPDGPDGRSDAGGGPDTPGGTATGDGSGFASRSGGAGTDAGSRATRAVSGGGSAAAPPVALFDRPLVIRRNGQYLGVSGRDKVFTLRELLTLVNRHAARRHRVTLDWEHAGSSWGLRLTTDASGGRQGGRQVGGRIHELTLQSVTTPSGNHVTRLSRLAINGDTVPDRFLLELFRNIKEGYEAQ